MSEVTLIEYANGDDGDQECLNQYIDALGADIVPRNSTTGAASNMEEDLGSSTYPIRYLKVNGSHFRTGTAVQRVFLTSDTFIVPNSCNEVYVIAAGAGGNGSLPAVAGSGGGTASGWVSVTPAENVTITISGGDASFGAYAIGYAGVASSVSYRGGAAFLTEESLVKGGFAYPGGATPIGSTPSQTGESTLTGVGGSGGGSCGGAGYNDGAAATASGGGGGGGYTAASTITGGAAGVEVRYFLLPGEVDPN